MTWEKVKLSDICLVITKGTTPSNIGACFEQQGINYIRSEMLTSSKHIVGDFLYISEATHEKLKRSQLKAKDILFSMAGVYLGKTAILREQDVPANTNQAVALIRVNTEKANPDFVYYCLNLPETVKIANTIQSQSAQPNINLKQIGNLSIPCPSLEIQERISSRLSTYDALIDNNQKQIKLLEEAAQRLYKEWFIDLRFPGHENTPIHDGLPEGWRIGTLDEIAIDSGKTEKKENRETYRYYLPIDCLPKESLAYTVTNDISLAESSLISFVPGDILFGAMRPYFHKVVVARDCGLTRSTCFVINAKDDTLWSYLTMLLFSKETIDYATKISVGTTMPYARWKDFIKMNIVIPTTSVLLCFDSLVKPVIHKTACLAKEIIQLAQSRDRLLPQLMSGELKL